MRLSKKVVIIFKCHNIWYEKNLSSTTSSAPKEFFDTPISIILFFRLRLKRREIIAEKTKKVLMDG